MKREIAEKWIADLRTNPPQATGALFDGKGHCCLGRLCLVLGATFEKQIVGGHYFPVINDKIYRDASTLHREIIEMAGMNSRTGRFATGVDDDGDVEFDYLTDINDDVGTFPDIADIIEAKWESL